KNQIVDLGVVVSDPKRQSFLLAEIPIYKMLLAEVKVQDFNFLFVKIGLILSCADQIFEAKVQSVKIRDGFVHVFAADVFAPAGKISISTGGDVGLSGIVDELEGFAIDEVKEAVFLSIDLS